MTRPPAKLYVQLIIARAASLLIALLGVYLFVGAIFPLINPGLFRAQHGPDATAPAAVIVIGALIGIFFMAVGYRLSRWADAVSEPPAIETPSPPPLTSPTPQVTVQSIRRPELLSFIFAAIGLILVAGPFLTEHLYLAAGESMIVPLNGILALFTFIAALGLSELGTIRRKRQARDTPFRPPWWKTLFKGTLAFLILISLLF